MTNFFNLMALVAVMASSFDAFQYKYYDGHSKRRRKSFHIYALSPELNEQYVAKTTESFKLADLYWLQSQVMCVNSESTVEKLAFHRPTASYLLSSSLSIETDTNDYELPFPLDRVQFVGKVIAAGANTEEFLDNITKASSKLCKCYWTLDYDTFEPMVGRQFSSVMLMCAVSRHIPGEPLLVSASEQCIETDSISHYVLAETSNKLYLIKKLQMQQQAQLHKVAERVSHFRQEWPRRPFQYSGAINVDIAIAVVDMLQRIMQTRAGPKGKTIRMLDPTVGSGTFLALACWLWNERNDLGESLDIVGVDSNPKCCIGAAQNMAKLFSVVQSNITEKEHSKSWSSTIGNSSTATIHCADSVELLSSSLGGFDCVVTNLPWNRNTFEFKSEAISNSPSSDLLKRLKHVMKPGAPVVVVSGSNDSNEGFNVLNCLKEMGFDIIGEVTSPPAGFSLPDSGKKKRNEPSSQSTKSSCVITVAVAPKQ
jgi:tRNA G10  N-methylase Trm11